MGSISDLINEILNAEPRLSARDIAKRLQQRGVTASRSDVNSTLYSNGAWTKEGDSPPLWFVKPVFGDVLTSQPARRTVPNDSLAVSLAPNGTPITDRQVDPAAVEPMIGPKIITPEQLEVMDADVSARIILNAPPGTGKTFVACGRIVSLLERGVPSSSIWLISFTRTAIAELRARVAELADSDSAMHGVVVGTVDSRAWRMVNGFTPNGAGTLSGGHEYSIEAALTMLREPSHDVREKLEDIQHLIIDEAQDLVGSRARLLDLLITRIPELAGVTILCDEAQSIYGFAEEENLPSVERASLLALVRAQHAGRFQERRLTQVHRTSSANLRQLYVDVRTELLNETSHNPDAAPGLIVDRVAALRDGTSGLISEDLPADNELLLYRWRYEALHEAGWLASSSRPYRLRTSALPRCVHPWVGILFSKHEGDRLSLETFRERWIEVAHRLHQFAPNADDTWSLLRGIAPDGRGVDVRVVREQLARTSPPDGFLTPEFGLAGPIISTIHASKGREADHVRLRIPETNGYRGSRAAEEARVLFVGATRARKSLRTTTGVQARVCYLDSGRVASAIPGKGRTKARVEIGRDGDVDPYSCVSAISHLASDILGAQDYLTRSTGTVQNCVAAAIPGTGYRYDLSVGSKGGEGLFLASFDQRVNQELFAVAKKLWPGRTLRPPSYINHLAITGARTFVAPLGDDRLGDVEEPFATSGFWLVPLITGLPTVPFFTWTESK